MSKIPINPSTGGNAQANNPDTWSTIAVASHKLAQGTASDNRKLFGVSFMLGEGFAGIDLDDCRDPHTGAIADWATRWIDQANSYTEISPSGHGVKIFGRVNGLEAIAKNTGNYEVYTRVWQFTVTGQKLENSPDGLNDISETVRDLVAFLEEGKERSQSKADRPNTNSNTSDDNLIQKISESRQAAKFLPLWYGDFSAYTHEDGSPDQTRADLALCAILAFWTDKNEAEMDRYFRQSGLMREKWDEIHRSDGATYAQMTIELAIESCTETLNSNNESLADGNGRPKETLKPGSAEKLVDPLAFLFEFPKTDTGNAERLKSLYGSDLRFVAKAKLWYYWDATRWTEDWDGILGDASKQVARQIAKSAQSLNEDDPQRERWFKFASKTESKRSRIDMIELAKFELSARMEIFDRDPWLFNARNGTIDLRTGEFRPPERSDYITQRANVFYNPEIRPDLWINFLTKVQDGNETMIKYLQRLVGYSLTGVVDEESLYFFHGDGKNGKSTFMETVLEMFGDYGVAAPRGMLLARKMDSIETKHDIARLRGKRISVASEIEQDKKLAEGLVKDLTGGDRRSGRHLYGREFEYDPTDKLFMYGNHRPRITGTDDGIWRRIHLIPFDVKIPEAERDLSLKRRIKAPDELSALFNWALEGCLDWQAQGLGMPDEVKHATLKYRNEQDWFASFLTECCLQQAHAKVKANDLFNCYLDWSKAQGILHPLKKRAFNSQIEKRGFEKMRADQNQLHFSGIGILEEREDLTDDVIF